MEKIYFNNLSVKEVEAIVKSTEKYSKLPLLDTLDLMTKDNELSAIPAPAGTVYKLNVLVKVK